MRREIKHIINKIENEVAKCLNASNIKSLLVAVSGGADSVALLTTCIRVAKHLNIKIEAVNCNFHLRGEESNRDSMYTKDLCQDLGVKLHLIEYNVEEYLKEHPGASTEMACRELRYADFFRILEKEGFDRVAVAHNSDDDVETMMLNMLRGSGSRGLKGMDIDNGKVIRPLLGVSRREIEEYLEGIGRSYVTDSSNLTSDYRRNFIRRDVLPLLESRWQGARKSLTRSVNIMKEESLIVENYYRKQLDKMCPQKDILLVYSEAMTVGIIFRFIEPYGGNTEIAEEIMSSVDKDFRERTWVLSDQYEIILERDRLIIVDLKKKQVSPKITWTQLAMTPALMEEVKGNRNHNIVYLPSDSSSYTIREIKTGDRMAPLGMKGTRLVSDIISDAKIDRNAKANLRVIVRNTDDEIIWLTGLKRSRHDLINEDSKYCYKVENCI